MTNVLIVTANYNFYSDIDISLALETPELKNTKIYKYNLSQSGSSLDEIPGLIKNNDVSLVVFDAELMDEFRDWDLGVRKACYSSRRSDYIEEANKSGIATYGVTEAAEDLLKSIDNGSFLTIRRNDEGKKTGAAPERIKVQLPSETFETDRAKGSRAQEVHDDDMDAFEGTDNIGPEDEDTGVYVSAKGGTMYGEDMAPDEDDEDDGVEVLVPRNRRANGVRVPQGRAGRVRVPQSRRARKDTERREREPVAYTDTPGYPKNERPAPVDLRDTDNEYGEYTGNRESDGYSMTGERPRRRRNVTPERTAARGREMYRDTDRGPAYTSRREAQPEGTDAEEYESLVTRPSYDREAYNGRPGADAPITSVPPVQEEDRSYTTRGRKDRDTEPRYTPEPETAAERLREKRRQRTAAEAAGDQYSETELEKAVLNDVSPKKKATVITVYSPKGGVGKTTIACELATRLTFYNTEPKVLIIDNNIDFGNVGTVLGYNELSPNKGILAWSRDIENEIARRKRERDPNPDNINYTWDEIQRYLYIQERSGLYALLPPTNNADTFDISTRALKIMADNVIHNAGFDYVVFDTGNNTRDSSIIPITLSDYVLLVLTQSIQTVECGESALKTMSDIGVDVKGKFYTVINMTSNKSGISSDDIKASLLDPDTKSPLDCLAEIKNDDRVTYAHNNEECMVYDPSSDFAKKIGLIADFVTKRTSVLQVPEKKGFLAKLFPSIFGK